MQSCSRTGSQLEVLLWSPAGERGPALPLPGLGLVAVCTHPEGAVLGNGTGLGTARGFVSLG